MTRACTKRIGFQEEAVVTREASLLKKIEEDDLTRLDQLITHYYGDIFRYCLWHTDSRQTAEDAAQETFLKFVRYYDRKSYGRKIRAYLYKIAVNVCIDLSKRPPMDQLPEELPACEPGYEDAEHNADFLQLVRRLPKDQQNLVVLRFGQDLTIRECAEITGLPLRTVQSRLRSALKKIKMEIQKRGIEDESK